MKINSPGQIVYKGYTFTCMLLSAPITAFDTATMISDTTKWMAIQLDKQNCILYVPYAPILDLWLFLITLTLGKISENKRKTNSVYKCAIFDRQREKA
jgi:hypothetical protein